MTSLGPPVAPPSAQTRRVHFPAHHPLVDRLGAQEALPVRQLIRIGVTVGLGTDVAGGYSPSMLCAMRHAVLASKTLQFNRANGCAFGCTTAGGAAGASAAPPTRRAKRSRQSADDELAAACERSAGDEVRRRELHDISHLDALHLATQAGADALGLGASLGSFDVGKRFDAVVLAAGGAPFLRPYASGVAEAAEDVLHKILTLGDDRNVKAVYVGGARIVADGQLTRAAQA